MVKELDFPLIVSSIKIARVVVIPTDTVYGLACSAIDKDAVRQLYEIKGRVGKPGTLIAANVRQLIGMGFEADEVARASAFWPGPVSVILSAPPQLSYLHMGMESLAVRIPEPEWLQNLLLQTGPLATTSANLPGEPTLHKLENIKKVFGAKVALYVDGGDLRGAKASQIIRIYKDGSIEQLR